MPQGLWLGENGAALAEQIVGFLAGLGIAVVFAPIDGDGFLPGMLVRNGAICVDPAKPAWPGDMLHEAGHIAVTDPDLRPTLNDVAADPGEEMAAIAWSVAAARAIGLPLEVVFHPDGYRDGSQAMIAAFDGGGGPGIPLLSCWGMTAEVVRAGEWGIPPFPTMQRWLR